MHYIQRARLESVHGPLCTMQSLGEYLALCRSTRDVWGYLPAVNATEQRNLQPSPLANNQW